MKRLLTNALIGLVFIFLWPFTAIASYILASYAFDLIR